MHTRVLEPRRGLTLFVRPLRNGDVRTVQALFERLSDESRRSRFNGAKPFLSDDELRRLATVDASRHALVAHVDGDPRPVAIARLVREGRCAEIAFAVADDLQRRGIGSALTAELLADARAAGITEVTALVSRDNRPALALLGRVLEAFDMFLDGPDLSIRAPLAAVR